MRKLARVAVVAGLAAVPLWSAAPASALCNVTAEPPLYVVVCVSVDPNIDWYCQVSYDRTVFTCPT